jgi:hypothetical protein
MLEMKGTMCREQPVRLKQIDTQESKISPPLMWCDVIVGKRKLSEAVSGGKEFFAGLDFFDLIVRAPRLKICNIDYIDSVDSAIE